VGWLVELHFGDIAKGNVLLPSAMVGRTWAGGPSSGCKH
jgi:hypothetical protein